MPLMTTGIDHPHAEELRGISDILDDNPMSYEWVLQNLTRDVTHTDTGAEGMTAEQVVRAAIIFSIRSAIVDSVELVLPTKDSRSQPCATILNQYLPRTHGRQSTASWLHMVKIKGLKRAGRPGLIARLFVPTHP